MKTKKLEKQIKDKNFLIQLKKIFPNKDFRYFLFSYCKVFAIDDFIFIKRLYSILFENQEQSSFVRVFNLIAKKVEKKYQSLKWKSLGIFTYFVYNYSLYYFKKYKSIYTSKNHIDLNIDKQRYFREFLDSLYELNERNFNKKIIDILAISI